MNTNRVETRVRPTYVMPYMRLFISKFIQPFNYRSSVEFLLHAFLISVPNGDGGRDSVFYVATSCELDGPGLNPLEARLHVPVQIGLEAHPAACVMGTGSHLWG
jgi:hypothetical protein